MVNVYGHTDLKQYESNQLIQSHKNNPILQETMTSGTKSSWTSVILPYSFLLPWIQYINIEHAWLIYLLLFWIYTISVSGVVLPQIFQDQTNPDKRK